MTTTTGMITLDEAKARTFLAEALRRWAGEYLIGSAGEDGWLLEPGWDPHGDGFFSDDLPRVEDLIYFAGNEGVITTPPDVEVDLMIDTGTDASCDWMYQVRVCFRAGCQFALCSPYRHEYKRLGWSFDKAPAAAKGCDSALQILTDVAAEANQILAAFVASGGVVPQKPCGHASA